jgi:pimeloyl-ACP methyl ester carboxylesterase
LVRTDAGYVHVRTSGSGAGPELLLLHQVPDSSRTWLRVAAELAPLPCIAPDMLNLGESDATDRPLRLEEHAEYLWQAVQQLRPGPKVVVGHHTGAALAAIIAGAHADEVLGFGLIGYPYYPDWRDKLAKYERLNPVPVDADGAGVAAAWQFVRRAFGPDAEPDLIFEAFADRMRAGRVWYEGYVALWNADLEAILRGAAASVASAIRPQRPTVVIAPERDPLSPQAEVVAGILGTAVTRIGGGSFVLREDPPSVAGPLCELYERATAGAG